MKALRRAAVRRLRSSRSSIRTSSRSCGVIAPTRATSFGIAAIMPKRRVQKSIASCSDLPLSSASPASTGRSSFFASLSAGGHAALPRHGLAYVRRDLFERRAGREDALDPVLSEVRDVGLRDDPAAEEEHVVEPFLAHELADAREQVVVRAREERQADRVR